MNVKKVKFVKINAKISGYGLLRGVRYTFEGMEEEITKMVNDGWTYSGFVPISVRGDGGLCVIKLIFTKEN